MRRLVVRASVFVAVSGGAILAAAHAASAKLASNHCEPVVIDD